MEARGDFDVIVAGGGMAGAAVAAAMEEFDYRVAVVEPGMDASRRLAGELIHPPGAAALHELGLLAPLRADENARIAGFSVHFGDRPGQKAIRLPYKGVDAERAFAMEHSLIRERMMAAVTRLPRVTVFDQARLSAVELTRDGATVTVSSVTGDKRMTCRMLVAADGSCSPVSRLAGLTHSRRKLSTLMGCFLHDVALPDPGFGHVFLGGPGPVLAYPVAEGRVRVMFDMPGGEGGNATDVMQGASLGSLPARFRADVVSALSGTRMIASASYMMPVREVTRGRLVLVGDAAGCCHPLTATGLTVCARDALRLRTVLRETHGDIPRSLEIYARRRRGPQRTRLVLARVLYDVFCAQTPELRLLRDGLRDYWTRDGRRCETSMSLLSTADGRLRIMLCQLARVIVRGLRTRAWDSGYEQGVQPLETRVLLGLSRLLWRHAGEAFRTT